MEKELEEKRIKEEKEKEEEAAKRRTSRDRANIAEPGAGPRKNRFMPKKRGRFGL